MEHLLNEQQKAIKGLAREIAEEKILPVRVELDEKEEFHEGLGLRQCPRTINLVINFLPEGIRFISCICFKREIFILPGKKTISCEVKGACSLPAFILSPFF